MSDQRSNRLSTGCLSLVLLAPACFYLALAIVPFYVYGIDQYSYNEINLQRVPGYPYSPGPFGGIIVLLALLGRPLILLYTVGLTWLILPGWRGLSRYERVVWSAVPGVTLIVTGLMLSPLGGAMTMWIAD